MNWLFHVVIVIALAWAGAQNVHAAQVGKGSGLSIGRTGPTTAKGSVKPSGSSDFDNLLKGPANLKDGKSDFERLLDLPFKLPDIPADKASLKGVLTPKNIGKALRGGVQGYVAGEAFKRLAEAACVRLMGGSMQMTDSGAWEECVPGAPPSPQSDGYNYSPQNAAPWFPTRQGACDRAVTLQSTAAGYTNYTGWSGQVITSGGDTGNCLVRANSPGGDPFSTVWRIYRQSSSCAVGKYVWSDGSCHDQPQVTDVTWRSITTDQAQQKLEGAIKVPGNANDVWDAIRDYVDKGGKIDIDEPLSVTGPAQSPASVTSSQTTSGGQTLTTTNTTVINYNYAGDTITVNQITNSVTRNQAGDVVSSTTTNGAPPPSDEAPTDTPLPPVPDLYTRKYPQGMEGIYDQYKDQLKNTSLVQLSKQLMPNVGDGGTCPSWPINLNWDWWIMYGVHDVAPPCWIWDVAKAILILSALLLARALIFGG